VQREQKKRPEQTYAPAAELPPVLLQHIGFVINKAAQRVRESGEAALAPLRISVRHFGVMALVHECGPLSQQTIGARLRCDRTTMVSVIDDLERLKFAKRVTHPGDRRAYAINLTEKGKRALTEAAGIISKVQSDFLAPLEAAERKQLNALLQKVL